MSIRSTFESLRCSGLMAVAVMGCCGGPVKISAAAVGPDDARAVSTIPKPAPVPAWAIGAKWYTVDAANFVNSNKSNGLPQGLPYLKDLGVNTLYLTGIFPQPEKPNESRLADLLISAHRSGVRVVIDAPSDAKELAAITRRWMDPDGNGRSDDGVDGWVAAWPGELPSEAWLPWREQVKRLNPKALIVADVSGDTRAAMASGLFDAIIDNATGKAVVEFFRSGNSAVAPDKLFEALVAARKGLSLESRLASPIGVQDAGGGADGPVRAAWRLALVFQHFFAGSPLTHYGDEFGLRRGGGGQGAMQWPHLPGTAPAVKVARDDLASLVQWLHARRDLDVPLRRGTFRSVLADGDRRVLAFARSTEEDEVILLMNYGTKKQKVMLPAGTPGTRVNVLTPLLDPNQRLPRLGRKAAPAADRIKPRRMAASHQVINREGLARLWVDPMSVRIVLVSKP